MTQRLQCAWCGVVLRQGVEPTSHGACDPCGAKLLADYESAQVADATGTP